jgi:hypothetical protein
MRIRTLLLEVGLIMAAIVLGAILNTPVGYCVAAVLGVAFLIAWWLSKDEGEDEFEGRSLFDGAIPSALPPDTPPITDRDPCIIPRYEKSPSATAGINNSDWFVLNNEGLMSISEESLLLGLLSTKEPRSAQQNSCGPMFTQAFTSLRPDHNG